MFTTLRNRDSLPTTTAKMKNVNISAFLCTKQTHHLWPPAKLKSLSWSICLSHHIFTMSWGLKMLVLLSWVYHILACCALILIGSQLDSESPRCIMFYLFFNTTIQPFFSRCEKHQVICKEGEKWEVVLKRNHLIGQLREFVYEKLSVVNNAYLKL